MPTFDAGSKTECTTTDRIERTRGGAVGDEVHARRAGEPRPGGGVAAAGAAAIERRLDQREIGGRSFDQAVGGRRQRHLRARGGR